MRYDDPLDTRHLHVYAQYSTSSYLPNPALNQVSGTMDDNFVSHAKVWCRLRLLEVRGRLICWALSLAIEQGVLYQG
jgi:hypothetical protein